MAEQTTGILLLYTGSPDAPTPKSVRQYLKRFLMDPYVLTMPAWVRCLLVQGIIVPFRAKASAAKYRAIWMPEGSPLAVLTHRFADALKKNLPQCRIAVGSAYGAPTVAEALQELISQSIERIVVLPLFPHFATATRGSLLAMLEEAARSAAAPIPDMTVIPSFYGNGAYVDAVCSVADPLLASFRPDAVVFSYHGLPVKQGRAIPSNGSSICYEEQCIRTTAVLAAPLGLDRKKCIQAYQSRFGRGWLGPSLEDELERLAVSGRRRVAVLAPSFVTDCLETLEELDIRAKERFMNAGGTAFLRVPALNDHPVWVAAAAHIITAAI